MASTHNPHTTKPSTNDHTTTHTNPNNTNTNTTNTATAQTGANDTRGTNNIVKTGNYVTELEHHPVNPTPIPVVGNTHQNRITGLEGAAGPVPRSSAGPVHAGAGGAPVGLSGPLGGAVVLGGLDPNTPAVTVNPGQNVGISDTVDHSLDNPHPM